MPMHSKEVSEVEKNMKKTYTAATLTFLSYAEEDIMLGSTEEGFFFGEMDFLNKVKDLFSHEE